MAGFVPRDLNIDTILTNLSIAWSNPDGAYIADKIFPIVGVDDKSGLITKFPASHWFRSEAKPRAPRTKSERGGFTIDNSSSYNCQRYSFGFEIDDEQRGAGKNNFELDTLGVQFATDKVYMQREVNFATTKFTTGVWTGDKAGGTDFVQWSDYAGSQPLKDIADYKDVVQGRIGRKPNTFVTNGLVLTALQNHPDVLDTIKYTQRGMVDEALLAALTGFQKFLVGQSLRTTTPEGTAENAINLQRIWDKAALMLYVPDGPSRFVPSAGYTYTWKAFGDYIQWIKPIMRNEELEIDIIECNAYYDQVVTSADAGQFLNTAIA